MSLLHQRPKKEERLFLPTKKDSIIIGFSAPSEIEEKEILRWDAEKWLDWGSIGLGKGLG